MAFCNKAKKKVKSLLATITETVFQKAGLALKVTTALRSILKSKVGDLVTALIPGDVDNWIRAQLIDALNVAIIGFEGLSACKDKPTLDERLQCVKEFLESKYPDEVEAILIKIAALMTRYMDGNKLPQNNYDTAAQVQYTLSK